ncbi:dynamin family protein [Demetria terragena]|uniref:dynamin family protein n=1 Tax=Demetria terragena TaxID=63959 RepID=UPI00036E3012
MQRVELFKRVRACDYGPVTDGPDPAPLVEAVRGLRSAVAATTLPLPVPDVASQRTDRAELLHQLDDYVLPRLSSLDAPLLAVVGGSTGAGKSTLVNSVVGEGVSRAGALRPTTRASVLIHHPDDARWFTSQRVLPGLARLTGSPRSEEDPGQLRLVSSRALPDGLALLDAPDIDSVVEANRDLARQLLSAADLWLFVTTASRYADAVPWRLLQQATDRGTSVAVVLSRVPHEAMEEVRADLARMLLEQGLGQSPIFTVLESALDDGLLPAVETARLRSWLSSLATDSRARAIVIRRTLDGALHSLDGRAQILHRAATEQVEARDALSEAVAEAFGRARGEVDGAVSDGSVLRGEVLARWQEFVGTGEWFRQFDEGVGRLRDKLGAILRGQGARQPAEDLGEALHTGVAALIASQGESASLAVARQWRTLPGGAPLLEEHPGLAKVSDGFDARVQRVVRDWQGEVLELVRREAGGRRATARFLSFGINGIGVMLMLVVFSATGGALAGAEVGVAGGSALVAQRVLESVFGDQAVRSLTTKARVLLLDQVDAIYAAERERHDAALQGLGVDGDSTERLSAAIREVKAAR